MKLSAEQFGTWKEANFEPEDWPWLSLLLSILGSSSSEDQVNLARMTRQSYIHILCNIQILCIVTGWGIIPRSIGIHVGSNRDCGPIVT